MGIASNNKPSGLPFLLNDYVELVEQTGRQFYPGKRKKITASEPILERNGLTNTDWQWLIESIETEFTTQISLCHTEQKIERKRRLIA